MSFILQIFHAPHAETVVSAEVHLATLDARVPPLGERFAAFVDGVRSQYPDGSAEDDDRNVWPEGLDAAWGSSAVVNLAVETACIDEALMSAIAASAARAGLHVLDRQNGLLYRPDGARVRWEPGTTTRAFDPRETHDEIAAPLQQRLAEHGFVLFSTGMFSLVARRHGGIRQVIAFSVEQASGARVLCAVHLWLSAPEVSEVWAPVLSPDIDAWKARHDKDGAGEGYDFIYGVSDLVATATDEERHMFESKFVLRERADAVDLVDRLSRFILLKLLPALEPVRDLTALAERVFTEHALGIVRRGQVRLAEQLGTLALAALARPDLSQQVAEGLVQNPNKARHWLEVHDPQARLLDRLIAHLGLAVRPSYPWPDPAVRARASGPVSPDAVLKKPDVAKLLLAHLTPCLSRHGFKAVQNPPAFKKRLKGCEQVIHLWLNVSHPPFELSIDFLVRPKLTGAFEAFIASHAPRGASIDLVAAANHAGLPPFGPVPALGGQVRIPSLAVAQAWAESCEVFLERALLPIAARCETIESFEQVINAAPPQPSLFNPTVTSLVLARIVGRPDFDALAEAWFAAVTPRGQHVTHAQGLLEKLRELNMPPAKP